MFKTIFWKAARWFLFRFDAEFTHDLFVRLIKVALRFGYSPSFIISEARTKQETDQLPEVFGMKFISRVGLAAGFDKNAEIIAALPGVGFGFAEIGTVTPRPQYGNPRPRLFRDVGKMALFNSMGFNNLGAAAVAINLERARPRLPCGFRVGVNIGKNRDTKIEEAASDYAQAVKAFAGLVDYVVINVSSPNTPGLRSLQEPKLLEPIVTAVNEIVSGWNVKVPILLKIAPELKDGKLVNLVHAAEGFGIRGWVVTNTLEGYKDGVTGGWSGEPLCEASRSRLTDIKLLSKLPIISVGGIMHPEEGISRINMGAELIQVYTGLVYGGSLFAAELSMCLRGHEKQKPRDKAQGFAN